MRHTSIAGARRHHRAKRPRGARKFTETCAVTGIVLTKLDGTAKGGIVVAIARELNLPIRYIGIGEKVDDLLPFDPEKFIESLFEK